MFARVWFSRWLAAVALCALFVGCGGPEDDADAGDATVDRADTGTPDDDAGPDGLCADDNECSDGLFCTGAEECDPSSGEADDQGCVAADAPCGAGTECREDLGECLPEGCTSLDADSDGHRSIECGGDDCDDNDALRFPGAVEVCDGDGRDEDCNPESFGFLDADGDGAASSACCNGINCGEDCNDADSTVNPRAGDGPPLLCDGVDNDCSGTADEGCPCTEGQTQDCGTPAQLAELGLCRAGTQVCSGGMFTADCIGGVQPQAEVCDEQDNDCDGSTDDGVLRTYYTDSDGDGFGATGGTTVDACSPPPGFAVNDTDCDDGTTGINPLASEACNGVNDDCDADTDEGVMSIFYEDVDGDSFGTLLSSTEACIRPTGYVTNSIDCDDATRTTNPAAPEACDGVDNNCNEETDEGGCACLNGTVRDCGTSNGVGGFLDEGECTIGSQRCSGGAWGSCTGATAPRAEFCNTLDDNCDGATDEAVQNTYYEDGDGDGFGNLAVTMAACSPPPGFVGNSADCNDGAASISPAATETCDGADNNCDMVTDPGCMCTDGSSQACGGSDGAGGEAGECVAGSQTCSGGVWTGCAGSVSPRTETCNQLDDNCNGSTDEALTVDCWADPDDDGHAVTGASMQTFCPVAGRAEAMGCPIFWTFRMPGNDDCADDDPNRFPGQTEFCNDIDDDCDGTTDEGTNAGCAVPSAYGACLAGACAIVGCQPGFGDCDGDRTNGCEANTASDSDNCSACGVSCGGGECSASLCELPVGLSGGTTPCVRFTSGRVACWGSGSSGALGDGGSGSRSNPAPVSDMEDATFLASGRAPTCVVRSTGAVSCWGSGFGGGLGNGDTFDGFVPSDVIGITNPTLLATGVLGGCAVTSDGVLRCWGRNNVGQIGDGSTVDRSSPVPISGVTDVQALGMGGSTHNCVRSGTSILCTGENTEGQLGDGTQISRSNYEAVSGISDASGEVAAGSKHSCAIRGSGTVSCWGSGGGGRLGNGASTQSSVPVTATGISDATRLTIGEAHTCALLADTTVACWGTNGNGQLGVGDNTSRDTPTAVPGLSGVIAIAAGQRNTCALRSSGDVYCWGLNHLGQVGDGTTNDRNLPTRMPYFGGVAQISGRGDNTCARRSTGALLCWGRNELGALGDGTFTDRPNPVEVLGVADYVDVSSSVLELSDGNGHACAVRNDGSVRCWGANSWGQLGDGSTTFRTSPVVATGLNDAVQVSAGALSTCALRTDGSVSCWGRSGTSTPAPVAGVSNVVEVHSGFTFACALIQDGTVSCWGSNSAGQLGVGDTNFRSGPTPVLGLDDAIGLTVGDGHSCALLSDRSVVCWGQNTGGQLGDGTSANRSQPTAVVALTQATDVYAGEDHTCARRITGELFCWGANADGQLGDGTTANRPAPISASGVGFLLRAAPGGHHTCAQIGTGEVGCWGGNSYGQLGDGTMTPHPTFEVVQGL